MANVYGVRVETVEDVKSASDETLYYLDKMMWRTKSELNLSREVLDEITEQWCIRSLGICGE